MFHMRAARPLLMLMCLVWTLPVSSPAAAAPKLRIAVLDFEGSGTNDALRGLGAGLQSMLTTDLAKISSLTVVERRRLAELRKEIKFTRSKGADKKTALRVGKLAGATHVVMGTYTSLRGRLRLDTRLVQVKTGKVVTTASAEGDIDAFFELAKKLARNLIAGLEVKPEAKERAALARVQTADLAALNNFGQGLVHFEAKDYDKAIVALEKAVSADSDFELARVTLDDYRELIAKVRAEADSLQMKHELEADLAEDKEVREHQKIARALMQKSRRDPAMKRLAALFLLSKVTEDASPDRFVGARLREQAVGMYFALARKHFPSVPLTPYGGVPVGRDSFPRRHYRFSMSSLAKDLRKIENGLKRQGAGQQDPRDIARLLGDLRLDLAGDAAVLESVYQLLQKHKKSSKLEVPGYMFGRLLEMQAHTHRLRLDIASSTKVYLRLKRQYTKKENVKGLKQIANSLETNQVIASALKRHPDSIRLREEIMAPENNRGSDSSFYHRVGVVRRAAESFEKGTAPSSSYRIKNYVLLDRVRVFPLWGMRGGLILDPFRTGELRFRATNRDPLGLAVFSGLPMRDFKVRMTLDHRVPKGLSPKHRDNKWLANKTHPGVYVFFGLRNLDPRRPDPERDRGPDQPFRIRAIALDRNEVKLVEGMVEGSSGYSGYRSEQRWVEGPRVIAKKRVGHSGDRPVVVEVRKTGTSVTVRVGKKRVQFKVKDARAGLVGILCDGVPEETGIVRIRDLKVERLK